MKYLAAANIQSGIDWGNSADWGRFGLFIQSFSGPPSQSHPEASFQVSFPLKVTNWKHCYFSVLTCRTLMVSNLLKKKKKTVNRWNKSCPCQKDQRENLGCPWCKPEGGSPRRLREDVLRENRRSPWQAAGKESPERKRLGPALKSQQGEGTLGGKLS